MADKLVAGEYAPFLVYDAFPRHVLGEYARRFKTPYRAKGLAVSDDGRTLRMNVAHRHGYNDRFVFESGRCVLHYICGVPEEQRRQNLNRAGDPIVVVLDNSRTDRHGVLHGTFVRVEACADVKPDGTELLVPRSLVAIHGYESEPGHVLPLGELFAPIVAAPPRATEHLVLDTESAAPLDTRLLGRHHAPFPVLELAYFRVTADFEHVLDGRTTVLAYDAALTLGNEPTSAVLKLPCDLLARGTPAAAAMRDCVDAIARTRCAGGLVIAHNVAHDLGQLRASADLLGLDVPPTAVATLDTVKTAGNFVPRAESRWMALGELAALAGVAPAPTVHGALHRAADDALLLLRLLRAAFPPDALDAYAQKLTL